jgi:tetratricopeptide (TPR) repeat protein
MALAPEAIRWVEAGAVVEGRTRRGSLFVRAVEPLRALLETRAIWPLLAAACLIAAVALPWVRIPLIGATGALGLPLELGWGIHASVLSYGLLCLLIAAVCCAMGMLALLPRASGRALGRPLPLRSPLLIMLGALALAIMALYVFQALLADFRLVGVWADQENQSLLIRYHLGYSLPRQLRTLQPFQVQTATVTDRLLLLVQVSTIGILLPALAGLLCLYGAWLARSDAGAEPRSSVETERTRRLRRITLVAAVAVGVIILARPPAALAAEKLGQDAVTGGDYAAAFDRFDWAERLNPTLTAFATFRAQRGEAQYVVGARTSEDASLYLAGQYRTQRSYLLAWGADFPLLQAHPDDPVVRQDTLLTLERIIESSTNVGLTPVDDEAAFRNPTVILKTEQVDSSMPWLDALLRIEPSNVYARYLRGRTLYALHAYELAGQDFQAILAVSHDAYARSAAYTYVALCRGGLGDYAAERVLLQQAVELDDGYYNTTARQAASGLH